MATIFKDLTVNDMHTDTIKTTTGLFNGGSGTLSNGSMATASLSSSNTSYFYTIQELASTTAAATSVFDVAYGHVYGSGSSTSDNKNATKAVYKQFANAILDPDKAKQGKFSFSAHMGTGSAMVDTDHIYIFSVKTDVTKDRLDGKFTLELSGSNAIGSGSTLFLTNQTSSVYYEKSQVGGYYKVISGSAGVPWHDNVESQSVYGHFYPEISTVILNATQMSSSLPGTPGYNGSGSDAGYYTGSGQGMDPDLSIDGTADNAGKFADCLAVSGSVVMRTEQDINQTTYYCRMFHNEFNFTSNPTFIVSGSTLGDIRPEFVGDPTVYVTTVGLYNDFNELIAVAKLNEPTKKNFSTEVTLAAKVDG